MEYRENLDTQDRVVEFALMLEVRGDLGEWREVVRIDTAHDEVHIHQFYRAGGESSNDL